MGEERGGEWDWGLVEVVDSDARIFEDVAVGVGHLFVAVGEVSGVMVAPASYIVISNDSGVSGTIYMNIVEEDCRATA